MYTIKQRAYGMCVYLKQCAGLSYIAQVPETVLIVIMTFDLNFKSKTFVSFSLKKNKHSEEKFISPSIISRVHLFLNSSSLPSLLLKQINFPRFFPRPALHCYDGSHPFLLTQGLCSHNYTFSSTSSVFPPGSGIIPMSRKHLIF